MDFFKKLMEHILPEKFSHLIHFFASIPGVGKKTATRYALYLYQHRKSQFEQFAHLFQTLPHEIHHCKVCYNITDQEICKICSNPHRQNDVICVVRDIRDVMAIENTGKFKGLYHVLGGLISPMDGITPDTLTLNALLERVLQQNINEIITALNTTPEGETTLFYIYRMLKPHNVKLTTIARGIALGDELEYTDELTLANSIENRIPYENLLHSR